VIYLKTPYQIRQIERINKMGAEFLQECYEYIKPGMIKYELEELARIFCEKHKVRPAFYKYRGFPNLLCVSVNEEVVHGEPSEYVLKSGDLISVDFGIEKDGYYSDAAFTKCVGEDSNLLVDATEESLYLAIEKAVPENRIHDISLAIYNHAVRNGFDVIRDYVGHATGLALHERPSIPNYVNFSINWKLRPGMVIAIEPMLVAGTYEVKTLSDGWTVVTKDGGLSAHFEHSIAIMPDGPRILSKL
jgi:methionyl aminopeptidase